MNTATAPATKPQQNAGSLSLAERTANVERETVLRAFDELKRRGDGELRVAMRKDKRTGHVELVFCGILEKADLEPLRRLYQQMRGGGFVSF